MGCKKHQQSCATSRNERLLVCSSLMRLKACSGYTAKAYMCPFVRFTKSNDSLLSQAYAQFTRTLPLCSFHNVQHVQLSSLKNLLRPLPLLFAGGARLKSRSCRTGAGAGRLVSHNIRTRPKWIRFVQHWHHCMKKRFMKTFAQRHNITANVMNLHCSGKMTNRTSLHDHGAWVQLGIHLNRLLFL